MANSTYLAKAIGVTRASCADISNRDMNYKKWFRLGGRDIVVTGIDYAIEANTLAAIDYAVSRLALEVESVEVR